MAEILSSEGKKLTQRRLGRITTQVAPLVARGATCDEVAEALGIHRTQAAADIRTCFHLWHTEFLENHERWRPLVISRYELMFKEALGAWEKSKAFGPGNPKYLDSATRSLQEMSKLLGLVIDPTLVQNNFSINTSDKTATAALAPLDAEAYAEMLKAGSLSTLNSIPPVGTSSTEKEPSQGD